MNKDINLRTAFNSEAELYHAIRPCYPQVLFDTLVKTTHLQDKARLLEIGLGTGQATMPFAERGYIITAIELGLDLAGVARDVLKKYKNVEIITGAFEDVELPSESFDLIYAATAFHWIKPEVRFTKSHKLLKPIGHLAIIHTNHVSDKAGDRFFNASQPIYDKYTPKNKDDEKFRLPHTADLKPSEVDENFFEPLFFKAFPMVIRYTADEYVKLLSTYSPTISMAPEMRIKFLQGISDLINQQFGGSIMKHYSMTLSIAKKKS
ncbi:MAG: SAM-dependent methyltransferase [Candidatus Nealsonbacteria bacterium CG08_land_8_20_14_0_20_43_11]|uniref:SAM-dependent methyltransferase n=1 Tax=Candidatus Nealsonbacteria bacterium CG08_land_8_20_14_0_20_43_11 TaxID=1974706 RepID=A0A2M6T1G9_9BACT|nr:MAG: SAM-dependent methyltransferase [Candidatus Nealsonbacteria bacterium CG08_land_8_20_14_0_20_43_11]